MWLIMICNVDIFPSMSTCVYRVDNAIIVDSQLRNLTVSVCYRFQTVVQYGYDLEVDNQKPLDSPLTCQWCNGTILP